MEVQRNARKKKTNKKFGNGKTTTHFQISRPLYQYKMCSLQIGRASASVDKMASMTDAHVCC